MKKNTKWIIIAVIVVVVALGAYMYLKKKKEREAMQPEGIPRKPGATGSGGKPGGPDVPSGTPKPPPSKNDQPAAGWPLKMGSKGERVKRLQKALKIQADGVWGNGTENAVYNYMIKVLPNSTKKPVELSSIIYAGLLKRLEMK